MLWFLSYHPDTVQPEAPSHFYRVVSFDVSGVDLTNSTLVKAEFRIFRAPNPQSRASEQRVEIYQVTADSSQMFLFTLEGSRTFKVKLFSLRLTLFINQISKKGARASICGKKVSTSLHALSYFCFLCVHCISYSDLRKTAPPLNVTSTLAQFSQGPREAGCPWTSRKPLKIGCQIQVSLISS